MNFLKMFFSIYNENNCKVVRIFGIKIKHKRTDLSYMDVKTLIMASKVNSNLEKYRGCHYGKDIVLVGCGPSSKLYKPLKKEDVYIGINNAFMLKDIDFDYLFAQDQFPEGMRNFANYQNKTNTCKKFIGIIPNKVDFWIRQHELFRINFTERYVINNRGMGQLPYDITLEPLADLWGTVFEAFQFALFTNPKRIYIVGCDCGYGNMYSDENDYYDMHIKSWKLLKAQIAEYWEEVEVIAINPVGLKGLFKDVYTQSYVDAHPELLNENIEIIKEEIVC